MAEDSTEFNQNKLADPSFWLSHEYLNVAVGGYDFVELGDKVIDWVWKTNRGDPKQFTTQMRLYTCVPKDESGRTLVAHAATVYEKLFDGRGMISGYSEESPENPLYVSPEMRGQMEEYAGRFPYLLDVVKWLARSDLEIGGRVYNSVDEYQKTGATFFGNRFHYLTKLFPGIADKVFKNIKYEGSHLASYEIVPPSDKFLKINEKYQLL